MKRVTRGNYSNDLNPERPPAALADATHGGTVGPGESRPGNAHVQRNALYKMNIVEFPLPPLPSDSLALAQSPHIMCGTVTNGLSERRCRTKTRSS
eukprot:765032-Hanusia_phi.AAC.7